MDEYFITNKLFENLSRKFTDFYTFVSPAFRSHGLTVLIMFPTFPNVFHLASLDTMDE